MTGRFLPLLWCVCCLATARAQTVQLTLKPERMRHAGEVEKAALAAHDSLQLAEAWYLYGKTYVFAGDYQTAQTYFMKSLRILEPRGDSFELSRLYVRLSETEGRLGRPAESLRLANRSLAIATRIRSDKALVRAYGALGRVYESTWYGPRSAHSPEFDRIQTVYRTREALCYKLKDTMGVAEASVDLGTLFTAVHDPRAVVYLNKALNLFLLHHKAGLSVNAMVRLSTAYSVAGKPRLAFSTLQRAERLYRSSKLDEFDIRLVMEQNYVGYFRGAGLWEEAFDHLEALQALERSQLMADNDGAITRLNIEYQTEKKEALLRAKTRDLALRSETLVSQRRLTLAVSILLAMAVGMSLIFFRYSRRNQRIGRRNAELVKEQNHRVKNNLQVVVSLLSLQSKRLTDEAAKKAVDESRLRVQSMAILHRRLYDGEKLAHANLRTFVEEVVTEVLRTYGFSAVETSFLFDDILLSADRAVPVGLIVNELTTNACKYAFPRTAIPRFSVQCHRSQQKIRIVVADNGPGWLDAADRSEWGDEWGSTRPASVPDTLDATVPVSFGMQLIQAQVEQLSGTYSFSTGTATDPAGVIFCMDFKG